MKKALLVALTVATAAPALARRGGEDRDGSVGKNRPETIRCALYFPGSATPQAEGQASVENASALIKGTANGVNYLFSVRGKTAVAKLASEATGQSVTAQGAIEMLRHGGRANLERLEFVRRGEDDAQDGQTEREAGFDLAITGTTSDVKLKCSSTNEVKQ